MKCAQAHEIKFGFFPKNGRKSRKNLSIKTTPFKYFAINLYFCPLNPSQPSNLLTSSPINHLAHCFLSFGDAEVLIGNFIGDFVKGSDWRHYPPGVQRGILLHRAIDTYTDEHPLTDRSVGRLRSFGGRYTPPVVDVLYDHLLVQHWQRYTEQAFVAFAEKTYAQLQEMSAYVPEPLRERLPRMLEARFLEGYASREGMDFVLARFSRRLPAHFDPKATLSHFWAHLDAFSEDFNGFFPDLYQHANQWLLERPQTL